MTIASDDTLSEARVQLMNLIVREAIEDAIDYREAEAAWLVHIQSGSRVLTWQEVMRELESD